MAQLVARNVRAQHAAVSDDEGFAAFASRAATVAEQTSASLNPVLPCTLTTVGAARPAPSEGSSGILHLTTSRRLRSTEGRLPTVMPPEKLDVRGKGSLRRPWMY